MASRIGGSEWVRWGTGLVLAALVSYLTAIAANRQEIAVVKATEESHFQEVLRRLDSVQYDIRELRRGESR